MRNNQEMGNNMSTLREQFEEFHKDNPQVYTKLVELTREAKQQGRRKIGIKMLWEVLRWHFWLQTSDEEFKLPNQHHAFYARLIMEQEEDLAGIFNLRRSIADEEPQAA